MLLKKITPRICHVATFHKRLVSTGKNFNQIMHYKNEPLDGEKALHGSLHWMYERILEATAIGLVGAAMTLPGPSHTIDFGLGLILPLHAHVGLAGIILDYLPARRFPRIYPVMMGTLYAGTALTGLGLFMFNTKDVGITEAVSRIWTAKQNQDEL